MLCLREYSARGFTDHEHLDVVGLIHMNGRVYDPELGRFMSADPFVQAPYNSQSYNRYSYVFNNPLSFTDPSGYKSCGYSECSDREPEETDPTIGQRSGCASGASCLTGMDAYYFSIAYTNSSNLTGFANGAFYDPNYFGQSTLFKEGIAQANADLKTALNKVDSNDALNQNLANELTRLQGLIAWGNDPTGAHAWAHGYNNNEQMKTISLTIGSVFPVGRGVSLGVKAASATTTSKFFYNSQSFRTISRAYWKQKGGANGASLHHWLFPQKAKFIPQGIRNAGFNLVELPALKGVFHPKLGLNQWMGFAQSWGGGRAIRASAVENMIRVGIPGSVAGSAYLGYQIGQD